MHGAAYLHTVSDLHHAANWHGTGNDDGCTVGYEYHTADKYTYATTHKYANRNTRRMGALCLSGR